VVIAQYNNVGFGLTTSLSDFITSIEFKLVSEQSAFYSPKIGKTYQTFTAHPKSRSFPLYMKKPLDRPYKLNFKENKLRFNCHGTMNTHNYRCACGVGRIYFSKVLRRPESTNLGVFLYAENDSEKITDQNCIG